MIFTAPPALGLPARNLPPGPVTCQETVLKAPFQGLLRHLGELGNKGAALERQSICAHVTGRSGASCPLLSPGEWPIMLPTSWGLEEL